MGSGTSKVTGIISTHSLTRRLMLRIMDLERLTMNFNSQPHKEADARDFFHQVVFDISTHSLTRRLTKNPDASVRFPGISTHSLTRRLTEFRNFCTQIFAFQLTASQGG